jgi:hypothetical protein
MKCLVPAARINVEDCERMAAIFAEHHCDTRQAGELYAAWRKGSAVIRNRILDAPELFFKTQRQVEAKPPATAASDLLRDLEMVAAIVSRAQRRLAGAAAMELDSQQCEAAQHQVHRIQVNSAVWTRRPPILHYRRCAPGNGFTRSSAKPGYGPQ